MEGSWIGSSLVQEENLWRTHVTSTLRAELIAATEYLTREKFAIDQLKQSDFPLPKLGPVLQQIAVEIESGLGFHLLSGLPVNDLDAAACSAMLAGIGTHFGTMVSQNKAGDLLVQIEDHGKDFNDPHVRGHETNAALPFHSDRCDVIALLCVRNALTGGESQIASAIALYREIQSTRPDLLAVLMDDFPFDRRGEESLGQPPWASMPILSYVGDIFVARYVRRFIEATDRFVAAPRLSTMQRNALDLVDSILNRPGFALKMHLQPGDLQFLNNYTTLHARSAYRDGSKEEQRRLLFRLWLSSPKSRPLPEKFLPLYNSVAPGVVRGGVWAEAR